MAAAISGRQRPALGEELAQRRAANELDDQVLLGLVRPAHVVDLDDVRVPQLGDGLGLGVEAEHDLPRVAQVRVDHLDGDLAREAPVARAVHRGHARRGRSPRAPRTCRGRAASPRVQPPP